MRFALALLVLTPAVPVVLPAQSVAPAAATQDSALRRPRPFNYFFRSLLVPGWGQASLNRKVTGGIFVAFEGLSLGMMLKTNTELHYLEATNSDLVSAKRAERQDWIVAMVMTHLFSALEAYVSANLFDFPADLRIRALPGGRTGFGVSLPVRH
jgi:hypothetical protein